MFGWFWEGFWPEKSMEKARKNAIVFLWFFCWILEAFRKKSERCDPRSTRKFSSGSWVAPFSAPARTDRKTHSKINETSFKNQWKINEKMVGFSNWFLNEFRNGIRRVLGGVLGLKIDEKTIENFVEILIVFWSHFERKSFPKGRPKVAQRAFENLEFRETDPWTPLGRERDPTSTNFLKKLSQNEPKLNPK